MLPPNIRFTAPVEIQAEAVRKGPPRFTSLAYSGGPMRIGGYDLPLVLDLAGLTSRRGPQANLDHDVTKRVGNIDDVQNDGRALTLAGVVSAASEAATEFLQSAANGYVWQASVEVSPEQLEEIPRGKTVNINGRTISGPVIVTRRGVLHGLAFVAAGADDTTSVAIAAKQKRGSSMSSFNEFLSETMGDYSNLTPGQLAGIHANFCGRSDVNADDHAAVAPFIRASADPVEAESRRLRQVDRAFRGDWGQFEARVGELKARAVEGQLTVDEAIEELRPIRAELSDDTLPVAHAPAGGRRERGQGQAQVIEAALCLNGGLPNPEQHYSERVLDAADKQRDMGLQGMLLAAAQANGLSVRPGQRVTGGNLHELLQYGFPMVRAGAGFSTIDVSSITSNVANKFLRTGWDSVDQTLLRIAAITPVTNFKERLTVSLTGGMQFEQIGADGEIKHGTLGELTYTNQADTYAVMCAITRQDIINDDLNALTAVPRKIGRGGMLKLNKIGWTEFLGAVPGNFFASGNNNINTAVADMTVGGLAATETIFINQTDPDGEPLGIMPSILLVPPALKAKALELMTSALVVTGASATLPNGNSWQGRFRVESSPYISNSAYTGNTTAGWWLLADPSALPVLEIVALNGNVMPTVETAQANFNLLGVEMRGYSDVGVNLQEYRGGVYADGGAS